MSTTVINIRLPEDLLDRLNKALEVERRETGFITMTRNDLIVKMIDRALAEKPKK